MPAELPEGDLVVLASASAARAYGRLGAEIPARPASGRADARRQAGKRGVVR